jgi:hypothetical protein
VTSVAAANNPAASRSSINRGIIYPPSPRCRE